MGEGVGHTRTIVDLEARRSLTEDLFKDTSTVRLTRGHNSDELKISFVTSPVTK